MLTDTPSIRDILYEQFNSRICFVDIIQIYSQVLDMNYNNSESKLLLFTNENIDEVRAFLEKNKYDELIFDILKHVKINSVLDEAIDICTCYCPWPFNPINDIIDEFKSPFHNRNCVSFINEGLSITMSSILVDVLRHPLAQFHSQIINTINLFFKWKKLGASIYLESYTSSTFSQFSELWVAERLNLIDYPSNIIVT